MMLSALHHGDITQVGDSADLQGSAELVCSSGGHRPAAAGEQPEVLLVRGDGDCVCVCV